MSIATDRVYSTDAIQLAYGGRVMFLMEETDSSGAASVASVWTVVELTPATERFRVSDCCNEDKLIATRLTVP